MFDSTPIQHPTWDDFAKALRLVDIYTSIEDNKCDAAILNQINALAVNHHTYNDPASYIRYVMYPQLMRKANWISDEIHVGRGTYLYYYGRRGDIDEFFSQMFDMGATRSTYIEMASTIDD